jgi:hypothetical protein
MQPSTVPACPGEKTMRCSDYRTLISHGRKAGLKTSEIYGALSSHRPTTQDIASGGDGNGYRPALDATGHQVYIPQVRGRTG